MSQDDLYRGDRPPGYGPPPGPVPPGYGPAAYAPPGYGPPPGYGWRRPNNQLAVVALVLSFLGALAPVGLVLGIVARGQIRRTGEGGEGLALAAVIVGGVITTVGVVVLVFWIFVLASIGDGAFAP
ncbi:MAG: Conserved rane protein of unknown function [Modestobacter sp.]|nr:Conserved rane protein of unknown function [Modestobacter sp.]